MRLSPSRPNPFTNMIRIDLVLSRSEQTQLGVYDVARRRVRLLVDDQLPEGPYSSVWDGRGEDGARVAGGTYFLRLEAAGRTHTQKIVFLGDR